MFNPMHYRRLERAGLLLAAGLATAAVPASAHAAPVDLATAKPFVVLAGSTVTNTGPSVLNGDLGVAPGTALVGFGLPAVVNGATHANDAVAGTAQNDLTTAYDVAAGQPVPPGNVLTGTDLGNRTLNAGSYRFDSSAQLTGPLILDAEGDPNAQFVFQIGSALTTASASSVLLRNGASPCNVFWQIGTSATLGTTTAFQGNVMALASISLNDGASVTGRLLARNGQISLINNVLNSSSCVTTTPTDSGTPTTSGGVTSASAGSSSSTSGGSPSTSADGARPAGAASGAKAPPASRSTLPTRRGTAILQPAPRRGGPGATCTDGFSATVRGRQIKRVVFRLDGKRIATRVGSPFAVLVRASAGRHNVSARVTFKDATRAKTMSLGYRACAAAVLQPRRGPSRFAG